jgi:hypothetical protein
LAQAAFAALVFATIGAFALAQDLKQKTPVVFRVGVTPAFSTVAHRPLNEVLVHFQLKQADDVTVAVLDSTGNVVARLAENRSEPAGCRIVFAWHGHTLSHVLAPPGAYRFQVGLRYQARTFTLAPSTTFSHSPLPATARQPAIPPPLCRGSA